jgi:phage head maturation protease
VGILIISKSKEVNIAKDVVYKDCTLLTEGVFTDAASRRTIKYPAHVLKKNAQNWGDNYLSINHDNNPLSKIGFVENPRWKDNKLMVDLRILPITQNAKDVINLIDAGLVDNLSVEALTEEKWNSKDHLLEITDIKFLGASIVLTPACEDAVIQRK